ncbi:hypothetical protein T265_09814 [Opisthorchis viverrini]|uniref:acylphosphatase n=1 Tax=Opisthorchis viverrini TaxID=6198 RepID=A0A074Z4I9_OPIVI|nr:hypothetical protein T265_09814 [Opisthorchis viverrini]KER21983.1 hypothetical protein T265_09814 [Opisthorchis viverrini]
MSRLRKCDFEVFGRVQGNECARKLDLVGWIKNTENNTVCGTFEGSEESVNLFKKWLATTGSPKSRIDKCEFSSEQSIAERNFKEFVIRR